MEQLIRKRLFKTGIACFVAGITLQLLGLIGMVVFFSSFTGERLKNASADQLAKAATLPHAAVVIGLGFIVFGSVMLFRSRNLHTFE